MGVGVCVADIVVMVGGMVDGTIRIGVGVALAVQQPARCGARLAIKKTTQKHFLDIVSSPGL
jgi:hypothetical protein